MTTNAGNPTPAYFPITGDSLVDGMTTGYVWALDGSRTIDLALADGFGGESWNFPDAVTTYLSTVGSVVSYYADVRFNLSGYYANPSYAFSNGADITVSGDSSYNFFNSASTWGLAFFPDSKYDSLVYRGAPGDIYINVASAGNSLPSYEPGSNGWFLLLHEFGHALGLKHPHDDGGTGRPTFSNIGISSMDSQFGTVMSYNDSGDWNQYSWDPATPMILDVYALQYLYGKNNTTNAGNDSHTLTDDGYYVTLWDSSGTDTLDVASSSVAWTIKLPDISLSTLVDTRAGLATPTRDFTVLVPQTIVWLAGDYENATGSRFGDSITGNLFNNVLKGNAGNDIIDGKTGNDIAVYNGSRSSYIITKTPSEYIVGDNLGLDGTDTLINIERLAFSDKVVALDVSATDNAGKAKMFTGAIAHSLVNDAEALGFILHFVDSGYSDLLSLSQLAIDAGLIATFAGSSSNQALAELVTTNVLGAEDLGVATMLTGYMDGTFASFSQAQFLAAVAALEVNQQHVDLVGLAQTGMEYVPLGL